MRMFRDVAAVLVVVVMTVGDLDLGEANKSMRRGSTHALEEAWEEAWGEAEEAWGQAEEAWGQAEEAEEALEEAYKKKQNNFRQSDHAELTEFFEEHCKNAQRFASATEIASCVEEMINYVNHFNDCWAKSDVKWADEEQLAKIIRGEKPDFFYDLYSTEMNMESSPKFKRSNTHLDFLKSRLDQAAKDMATEISTIKNFQKDWTLPVTPVALTTRLRALGMEGAFEDLAKAANPEPEKPLESQWKKLSNLMKALFRFGPRERSRSFGTDSDSERSGSLTDSSDSDSDSDSGIEEERRESLPREKSGSLGPEKSGLFGSFGSGSGLFGSRLFDSFSGASKFWRKSNKRKAKTNKRKHVAKRAKKSWKSKTKNGPNQVYTKLKKKDN